LLIRARSKAYRAYELENIIVKATTDGMVVRLGDIAELKDRWADLPQRNYFNGNPSVTLTVQNTNDEDFLAIQENVKAYIIDFNAKNDVVQAAIIRDASLTLIERPTRFLGGFEYSNCVCRNVHSRFFFRTYDKCSFPVWNDPSCRNIG
jgi:multidrug efflux pump subunit AcrB